MSEDHVPEWQRAIREFKSQLSAIWNEISKLTDWQWKNEKRIDNVEERLTGIEDRHTKLRREFDRSDAKPIRNPLTFHPREDKPPRS
jgi:septal ring factor EnvC (AmiA/AmiB activator)